MRRFTKETWRRALRTFWQAFFASIVGTVALVDTTDEEALLKSVIFVVVVPALSAGIAALMNLEESYEE